MLICEVAYRKIYVARHTRSGDVALSLGNGLRREIRAVDVVVERALRRVVIVHLAAELTVEVRPPLEGVALTVNAGRRTRSDQRSLHEEGARPAERIHQITLSVPARLE